MRYIESLLLIAVGIVVGFLGSRYLNSTGATKPEISTTTVLEQVRGVAKMVTAEGDFTNILTYQDHKWFDFGPFQKKAIVRVKARIMAGFDMTKMSISADSASKTITIKGIPPAQVLGMDTDFDYYDLQNGMFNSFGATELTQMHKSMRNLLEQMVKDPNSMGQNELERMARKQAAESFPDAIKGGELLRQKASEQGIKQLELIEFVAKSAGFTVVYPEGRPGAQVPVPMMPKG